MEYKVISGAPGLNINATPGQQVKLTLKNIGSMPIEAMGHNFVLLKAGVKYKDFAERCGAAKGGTVANGYLPAGVEGDILVKTKMLGPGEEETIEFTLPTEPGTYDFVCTYQGHWGKMHGVFAIS